MSEFLICVSCSRLGKVESLVEAPSDGVTDLRCRRCGEGWHRPYGSRSEVRLWKSDGVTRRVVQPEAFSGYKNSESKDQRA